MSSSLTLAIQWFAAARECWGYLLNWFRQQGTNNPVNEFLALKSCRPIEFLWSVSNSKPPAPTTRGSSVCQTGGEAEATRALWRFVALCGTKQGPQGFVADPQKTGNISGAMLPVPTSANIYLAVALTLAPARRKAAWFRYRSTYCKGSLAVF